MARNPKVYGVGGIEATCTTFALGNRGGKRVVAFFMHPSSNGLRLLASDQAMRVRIVLGV